MKKLKLLLFACTAASSVSGQSSLPVYLDNTKPIEQRIEDALSRMTLEEKVAMCHAQSKFSSAGVARLGIPENWMSDGPHGVRPEVLWDEWNQAGWTNDSCIAFPALTCLAATWNPEMAARYGKAIGEEARYRNKNVLLGPGVNIYRTPLNGRNFEYMGEDPFLASQIVVPYVRGVQSNGVAACVKHFALNNQEAYRHEVNVEVSDRALHEIYLPAFKAAVTEGKAWAIMGAYNKYKGQHACHNQYLLVDVLRKMWHFDGVAVSDWGGVHDTREAIYNGLDMEFGSWTNGLTWGESNAYASYFLATPYLKLLKEGKASEKELDAKVRNILRLAFRTTMNANRPFGSFGTPEHALIGRQVAQEGIVLLKNSPATPKKEDFVLPIDFSKAKKIAVIGENAIKVMTVGGGSSSLKAKYEISPLEGIKKYAGNRAEVVFARGYVNDFLSKEGGMKHDGMVINDVVDTRPAEEITAEAVAAAKNADVVIFIGGLNKYDGQDCEGGDRKGLELPYGQDKVIAALAKANKNLAVVIISGNAVAMPWVNDAPAVVQAWYNGSEAGNALAAILTGEANPSGKLPFSFPVELKNNGAHALGQYPGDSAPAGYLNEKYSEDIFVGYRWLDKQKIKPLFPFGHGLSYTNFEYKNLKITDNGETVSVNFDLTNTGKREGSEASQVYVALPEMKIAMPVKQLKGFAKTRLSAGETRTVEIAIPKSQLSYWDESKNNFVTPTGTFEFLAGASSADLRLKGKLKF
ncbi:MAG: glycoside hydrolase family 3 C-terminal domain-containing protein [Prevotellaceae bacterium]|jgi:beta-glucosidase|nr:glycoside hydrolase family 3 C-terminal domain-containing protein [Prevotellaceae bacterium]